jgi:PPM family protein phosphatase
MIESFGASDAGCVRSNNEDYFLVTPALGLYLVADGMGGAQAGEHASRLAAETVAEQLQNAPRPLAPKILVDAFMEANRRVMEEAQADPGLEGMGTTLTAAVDCEGELLIANVGDSRLYTYDGALKSVTEDQTWVNEVGRRLGLDEGTLKNHPMRHVLTMAIGVANPLRVHSYRIRPTTGMQILLCSDGLHGVATESEIEETLASNESLEGKCQKLISAAKARGGPDNITAVLLKAGA